MDEFDFIEDEIVRHSWKGNTDYISYLGLLIRCKDCEWYDERISMCDNCGLPREQTFFCADGKRR